MTRSRMAVNVLSVLLAVSCATVMTQTLGTPIVSNTREEAYRANNVGVALLEQFNYRAAIDSFKRALGLEPQLDLARINLAIALYNLPDYSAAWEAANSAAKLYPGRPQPQYILGLIARNRNQNDEAAEAFRRVLVIDPADVGANVNLGQILIQERQYKEATDVFRLAVRSEPYNSTALYNLATALLRQGGRDEGQKLMTRFQSLRQSGAATSIGQNYFEQGRYAEALVSTGMESVLVDAGVPDVRFEAGPTLDANRVSGASKGRSGVLFDFDNDSDLDLVVAYSRSTKLFRNDAGRFVDVSSGLGRNLFAQGVIAGDYDNDGNADLLFFDGALRLLRGDGNGKFADITAAAKLPGTPVDAHTAAFLDADHDGDLDVFLGSSGRAANVLLRNNGDGTFTDISSAAKIDARGAMVAVVPTDFDNRRDIDVLVAGPGGPPQLWRNMRDTTFRNVAAEVGLARVADSSCVAAGDVNKDGYVDFFFGRASGTGVFALSNGRGDFKLRDAPRSTAGARAAQFIDYDNDGLLDLVTVNASGFGVLRDLGGEWQEARSAAFLRSGGRRASAADSFLSGDLDGDGDVDLIAFSRAGVSVLTNVGGNVGNSETVALRGRVGNRSGIGAKVDVRAGSLWQKLESYSASPMPAPSDIHFGLGARSRLDAVRIIWPSGVIQAETSFDPKVPGAARVLKVEELDRKPSSCPYLYTWNGERFEFVTDFMGGGESGSWQGDGGRSHPDPDEFVRIPPGALRPKDGRLELRVTNELEEVLFVDQLKLVAVEHDVDAEVYPNEGLGIPTNGQPVLYTTKHEQPPLYATDAGGRDVLAKIAQLDRQFYDSFEATSVRGYAKEHALTLRLDDKDGYNGRTILLLTGWTDYAFSSDNVAASQSGRSLFFPKLQVKDAKGDWQTVIDSIGIAVGRPQTVVADLTGKFLSDSREVRIVTNVKTYWDKVAVDTSEQRVVKTLDLSLSTADLRERGFSRQSIVNEMVVPDYEKVVNDVQWKYFSGTFTRTGDVRGLLRDVDDVFLISKTGDEIALSFVAPPEAPAGKKYTFLLFADGYSKEMDINSASPDTVLPLPFRGMSGYPYGPEERFPMTEEKQRIYDAYNTRVVRRTFRRIESILAGDASNEHKK